MKRKNELESTIVRLEEAIEANNTDTRCFEADLKIAQKKLEDINKPELTPLQFDLIQEAIEESVGNFSFDEQDNYDKEFGIEYDGKVYLESIDLTCSYELIEKITEQVHKLFSEAEDDNSELNTQTVAEKVI